MNPTLGASPPTPAAITPGAPRRTLLRAVLVTAAVVGLLGAFDRVVRLGVQQGAARRADVAAQAEAVWRCRPAPGSQAQDACRRRFLSQRQGAAALAYSEGPPGR
jgi:hypothetical protein